jgi:hypothetical protein
VLTTLRLPRVRWWVFRTAFTVTLNPPLFLVLPGLVHRVFITHITDVVFVTHTPTLQSVWSLVETATE